ncbi:MAG: SNF2-related protein [bacterium]|nr:SNF2-related protein [bacterium]
MTLTAMIDSQGDELLAAAEMLAWRDGDGADRTYGKIEYQSHARRWVISGLETHVAVRVKRIFPRISLTQVGLFGFADNDETRAELEWFASRYPLQMSPDDRLLLSEGRVRYERIRGEINQVLQPDWTPAGELAQLRDGFELRANQARAVEIARRLGRLIVADDVGLGKTLAAIASVMDPRFLPVAIIVQPQLAIQWQRDFIQQFTTLTSHVVQGAQHYVLPVVDCYIFKYTNIFGWTDTAATGRFASVIFDEVQELRHGTGTMKGGSAKVFADNASMRIGLSATPVFGYGGEMFNIVDIIEPGVLGSRDEFVREWCTSDDGKMIVKDSAALGAHLYDINLLLREVGKGPPPNRIIHDVPYDEEVAAADEAFARLLAQKVLEGSFSERGQAARELDMYARRVTGVAKARHVAAYVKILLEAKVPVILGGWHRDVYDIWLEELKAYNPMLYTGTETPKQKDAVKRAFMTGETDCIIMSLRSGAGLDGLQHRCSTVVHGELDWSREVHKQLAGRLRPHARKDPITEIYVVADGGSDPVIAALQGLKASQAHGIVDPKRGVVQVSADDSRMKALARAYLERSK